MTQRGDTAYVKVADTKREVGDIYIRQSGHYDPVDRGYEKVSGVWEEIYRRASDPLPPGDEAVVGGGTGPGPAGPITYLGFMRDSSRQNALEDLHGGIGGPYDGVSFGTSFPFPYTASNTAPVAGDLYNVPAILSGCFVIPDFNGGMILALQSHSNNSNDFGNPNTPETLNNLAIRQTMELFTQIRLNGNVHNISFVLLSSALDHLVDNPSFTGGAAAYFMVGQAVVDEFVDGEVLTIEVILGS